MVESLEGRLVLSHAAAPHLSLAGLPFDLGSIPTGKSTAAERAALLAALRGGAGREFITLARREVKNIPLVVAAFSAGLIRQYSVRGLAVKLPKLQEQYTGPPYDQLNVIAAGAVLANSRRLVLGAILRGPIDIPVPSTYVFAFDRGTGRAVTPFPSRPALRYDATVTVTVNGRLLSAVVSDPVTGVTTPLDRRAIKVRGATLQVVVPPKLLSGAGGPLSEASFAFWTQNGSAAGIQHVGSFVSDTNTRVGTLGRR
jgi:hypothetical protein